MSWKDLRDEIDWATVITYLSISIFAISIAGLVIMVIISASHSVRREGLMTDLLSQCVDGDKNACHIYYGEKNINLTTEEK